eukprot:CAMPEP_0179111240 /NCGR_PEP_ID=MMETSP0796-20121207/51950_1 /TAXON_ID=73915 /ORGANISM="Pyrodinium bahamense, Strain pbaha01" /LENGTH=72 /DNA_ID=CAMNT_0020809389 /DNA_START=35 /DNA_END=253 /DNA_ORIENTATION=-
MRSLQAGTPDAGCECRFPVLSGRLALPLWDRPAGAARVAGSAGPVPQLEMAGVHHPLVGGASRESVQIGSFK